MGIKNNCWEAELIKAFEQAGAATAYLPSTTFSLVSLKSSDHILLNLISIACPHPPDMLIDLQQHWAKKDVQVLHLWEDVWLTKPQQVLSRINSILGKNKTIHGRKTKIIEVSQRIADEFYQRYHLQGSAGCKYRIALVHEGEMVAIAGFSGKRKMRYKAEGYTSVELIRFATADGFTVTGGLSKLIRHMVKELGPDDVMSYADMDWSAGQGYLKLGFQQVAIVPPMPILLNINTMERCFPQRLPAALQAAISTMDEAEAALYLRSQDYVPLFNTGNLKYILYL